MKRTSAALFIALTLVAADIIALVLTVVGRS
jgi:hypothetical protein